MWIFGYGSLIWKADFTYESRIPGYVKGYQRRFWQASTDHRGTVDKPGRVVTLIQTGHDYDIVWGVAYKIREKDVAIVRSHLDHRERTGYRMESVIFYPDLSVEEKKTATSPLKSIPSETVDNQGLKKRNLSDSISKEPQEREHVKNVNVNTCTNKIQSLNLSCDGRNFESEPFTARVYIASRDNPNYVEEPNERAVALQIYSARGLSGDNVDYLMRLAEAQRDLAPGQKDEHLNELEACVRDLSRLESSFND